MERALNHVKRLTPGNVTQTLDLDTMVVVSQEFKPTGPDSFQNESSSVMTDQDISNAFDDQDGITPIMMVPPDVCHVRGVHLEDWRGGLQIGPVSTAHGVLTLAKVNEHTHAELLDLCKLLLGQDFELEDEDNMTEAGGAIPWMIVELWKYLCNSHKLNSEVKR